MEAVLLISLLALLIIGLAFTVLVDSYISRKHRNVMLVILALVTSLIARDWFDITGANWQIRKVVAVYGYSVRPVILILYGYIVSKKRQHWAAWILAGINLAIHLTAFFSSICFTIDPEGGFYRGPLGYSCHVFSALLFLRLIWLTVSEYRHVKRLEMLIPIFNAVVIVAAVLADSFILYSNMLLSCLDIATVSCSLFYYIWLHLQFVREHEHALVADQRMQIMLSQIQPHFLYNALAVIQNLCRSDPAQAEAATIKFSKYLRGNMDSLLTGGVIPFGQELEHTREYLALEQMRFREKLEIRYDIGCTDFELPALTLQPIAENAVRHGIRGNPDGAGRVAIATREYPDRYEITVTDNGAGFDPNSAPEDARRSRVGIKNVRERLDSLCRGTLTLRSSVGEGTEAVITLPKEATAK